jgi:hypothetical protein
MAMSERTPETIEAELSEAKIVERDARQRVSNLKAELEDAKVAAQSHPWIGKTVTAKRRRKSYRPGDIVEKRGTVVVFDRSNPAFRHMRGAWGFNAGEAVVLSPSGKSILGRVVAAGSLNHDETPWELAEEVKP